MYELRLHGKCRCGWSHQYIKAWSGDTGSVKVFRAGLARSACEVNCAVRQSAARTHRSELTGSIVRRRRNPLALARGGGQFDEKRLIPMPSSPADHQAVVELSATESAKVLLMNEMIKQDIRKAELARRLEVFMPQVDRLLNLRHSTKLDFIEKAYNKLGKKIHISVQ